jgi:hypothetical protein
VAPRGHDAWGGSSTEPFYREADANQPASFLTDGEATKARNTNRSKFEKEGHMRQAKYRFLLLPLFFVLACVGLYAQANSEVTGIVTDQTGAVVAGAKIVLTDPATGTVKTTASGATGLYDISGLNPANYNMKVTAKGFEAFVQNGIVVNVSTTDRVDVKLTVGSEAQTITVEADALAVQADSNVVSTLISSEQISEIATENRNFAALAALGLGVSSALPDSNTPGAVGSNFTISVNGLRQSHNIWLIDGGESDDRGGAGGMQIQPSQDAIAEFTVMSSNYPPDYGISSGATISLSLKSGTQKFHGEVWEENRNTDYDANGYFNKQGNNPRPAVHYNIYGWGVGGPVFIPKVYNANKQKTFFYWNEEWRKTVNLASSNNPTIDPADIPTSLTSDLTYVAPLFSASNLLLVPNVPTNSDFYLNHLKPLGLTPNTCFTGPTTLDAKGNPSGCTGGQVIPHQLFDSNFYLYLKSGALPAPNVAGQDKTIASASLPFSVRDDIVRIDHKFNDKWAILGHYIGDTEAESFANPELGWCWCSYNTLKSSLSSPSHSAAIKLSGTINPNLLVEASINYDGNMIDISPTSNSLLPSGWSVSPVVAAYTIARKVLPGISGFGGPYWTAEDTATEPYHNAAQDYEPKLDISYTVGKHAMKFGMSYNRYTKNQMLYGDAQGDYGSGTKSGDGIMDLLMGIPTSYSQAQSAPIRHYVNQTPSVYVMDNWHVTPRLSLQIGIRYDALPHAWERNNYIGNFVPGNYNPNQLPVWDGASGAIDPSSPDLYTFNGIPSYINGTGLAGVNHFPAGAVNNDYKTYQPRVGFSEDLFGNGKTVLRGGFGTFFERMQGNDIYGVATSAPFDPALSISNPYFSQPGKAWDTGAVIAPTNLIFAGGAYDLAQHYSAPAVAQYSLGVQHELAPSVVAVVQYVGNLAWHQNIQNNINNDDPNGPLITSQIRCITGDNNDNYAGDTNCNQSLSTITPQGGGNAYRKYPGYTGITQSENDTNGSYNGFQAGVRVQNKWGLSGELDYTYSHEIDVTSYDLTTISNPWNYKYDKGSGALDRRQMLSANYIYKLPIFTKDTGLVHSIAGGWELAGTVIDETGTPTAPGESLNYDPVGLGGGYTVRPNATGKMTYPKKVGQWFDTTKLTAPIPFWLGGPNQGFGNSGKDAIVGPGRVNFSTSLYKSFAFTERARFELRIESFNTFNHSEFNSINTSLKGGQYGQVTSTWDPRALELGGKFVF